MDEPSSATLGSQNNSAIAPKNSGGKLIPILIAVVIILITIVGAFLVRDIFLTSETRAPRTSLERDMDSYQRILAKDSKDWFAHLGLGQIYYQMGSYSKAINEFKEAAKLNPKGGEPLMNLALTYRKTGKTDRAIKELKNAIKVEPSLEPAVFELGRTYYDQKKYEEAKEYFEKSLTLYYESSDTHLHLGKVYAALGNNDSAEHEFNEALKYYPDYEEALKALKDLKK